MRKVLASLKPYYYYLVGEGIKKIEVRKDMPKASDWNKEVLFYMSKDVKSFAKIPKELQEKYRKHFGKVGLKFICDKVEVFSVGSLRCDDIEKLACLSYTEMINYFYKPEELDGKTAKFGYGWHISDLKIYGKPKELSEFNRITDKCVFNKDGVCQNRKQNQVILCKNLDCDCKKIVRPPQSWCYMEGIINET